MIAQTLLTKLAGAGLATKAAAGGAAVVVAASAAGAAEALPDPAQHTFDAIVQTDEDPQDVTIADEDLEGEDNGEFGERVSDDATGADGSEPGVNGAEISEEAKANANGNGDGAEDDGEADSEFGKRVSDDATGADGSAPGVDGAEISEEAKANANGADDASSAAGERDDDDEEEEEEEEEDVDGEGGPEGTPGESAVDTFRPGDDS